MHDQERVSVKNTDRGTIGITPIIREISSIWLSTAQNRLLMRLSGDIHTIHRFYYYYDESLYKENFH